MKPLYQHIIVFFLIAFSASTVCAQSVSVRAAVNRDRILIGEPITLKLEAKVETGTDIKWFPLDSIAHFEWIDKPKVDTVAASGSIIYSQNLSITSFDSGRFTLGPFAITIGNREYLTDSFSITTAYSNFDTNQDYHDIKDILEIPNAALHYINWILAVLALLSLLAIVYFLRKKTSQAPVFVEMNADSKLTAFQEASLLLDNLQKQGFHEAGIKAYHTRLNDILRNYLYRRTGTAYMGKTSGELLIQLQSLQMQPSAFSSLAAVLRMNDAVKFAKYLPEDAANAAALVTVRDSIEQLEKIISS